MVCSSDVSDEALERWSIQQLQTLEMIQVFHDVVKDVKIHNGGVFLE